MGGETPSRRVSSSLQLSQPGFGQEGHFTVCFQVLKFSFYEVYWTVPTSNLPASLLTDSKDGIQFLFSLSQEQVHLIWGWWWQKNPICWLPFRKPITWKNSRNAIAHLKNSNTGIKCSASSPLNTQNALGTQEGSQKDKSCTSGHCALEGCTKLLL